VLDYSTDVGPFTIVDQSGEGNTATLYSGRGLTMDAVNDTVTYDTTYTSASRTATVWMRVTALGARTLNGATGTFTFTPTATNTWEELSSTATVSGDLAWTAGSDCDIGDLTCATEHWTHNDWSDPTGDTSNGKTIVDSGANQLHGTCTGCSGFTGEATIPQTADKNWNKYSWFNGTNAYVSVAGMTATTNYFGACAISADIYIKDASATATICALGSDAYRILISAGTWRLNSATNTAVSVVAGINQVSVDFNSAGSAVSLSINGAEVWTGTATSSSSATTFLLGARTPATPGLFWDGTISNFSLSGSLEKNFAYTGLGNDPWKDTIGSNDGTESGTFTRELVSASDANDQIDALGTAILEPRLNTQQLNLFGDGEYSSTPDSASLDLTTTATWEVWGNFYGAAPASTQAILSKTRFSGDERTVDITKSSAFADNTVNLAATRNGLSPSGFSKTLTVTDKLSHIVFTYDGATQTMVGYIDGVPTAFSATSGTVQTSLFANTQPYMIGARPSVDPAANFAPFKIGSAKIYNVALTADEVLTNYNTQKSLYGL
jgi:hypothetical protein